MRFYEVGVGHCCADHLLAGMREVIFIIILTQVVRIGNNVTAWTFITAAALETNNIPSRRGCNIPCKRYFIKENIHWTLKEHQFSAIL